MDDIVKQAMAKWPNVPDCYGWLGLDNRGNWYMRDDRAQTLGAFDSGQPGAKGSLLQHDKLIDFIGRNYSADVLGRWFFQNGPQRVYVELQAAPLVWRVQADHSVKDHIGRSAQIQSCWLDELGHLFLAADTGLGLVHTQDMSLAADAVVQGLWLPQDVSSQDLPGEFGFVKSPYLLQLK
ncbi:DUF2946 family protein [Rhodoferax antarcticus]|uniref:DUF2946 domain-containing protein n=1 Tax=Rhodoferax antarcticus ANT.BR TaxID=1111071 RepID=A0A1Q8YFQ3_9BURK|nr:DUF2946 family protein [Rhodoferax antarcticus]APW45408.1 hypothetical protein RA876_02390 [Rhodoferax antarcticus]MCW2312739.1 hypothetical protein [Rhodoferax antarcticus]OLP06833.1 hypothetical protein BLL52_1578 [Rhodoferax antarcticus ANT.BR]